MSPDDQRHGSMKGFYAGCRDACCRRARARYEKEGRLARLSGGRAVPALGAQRRMQALMRLGWSSDRIAAAAGLPHRNHVLRIINGQKGKPTSWITRRTNEWVSDVYDQLSMKIPTGPLVGRTRAHAERLGYLPPLMWDNIDDPDERPHKGTDHRRKTDVDHGNVQRAMAGDKIRLTKAERFEVVRRMRAQGWSLVRIEKHVGLTKAERYVERESVA